MKNAKIVAIAPTVAAVKLASQIVCAQKFASVESAKVYKNKGVDLTKRPQNAAAPTGDAVMSGVVESGKKAATKVENYSAEVTEKLLAAWGASDKSKEAVVTLASQFGKTARSIVAKLSREKVYVKQAYVTKTGEVPVSKEQHVAAIAAFMGLTDVSKLESLEKANKGVLQLIEDALKRSAHDADNAAE